MSFRIIHYAGNKEALIEKVKANADQIKEHEDKDCFDADEWDRAVDCMSNDDFSSSDSVPFVLSVMIGDLFPPVSDEFGIRAYRNLSDKVTGKLSETLLMFENGRNFSTGRSGFGEEATCGYLTAAEVKELLGLLKAYTPDSTCEDEQALVDDLISTFTKLAEQESGDLFIMS